MLTLLVVVGILLVLVNTVKPCQLDLSDFERNRRKNTGDKSIQVEDNRSQVKPIIISLQQTILFLLVISAVLLATTIFDTYVNIIVLIIGILLTVPLSSIGYVHKTGQFMYEKLEPKIVTFLIRYKKYLTWLQNNKNPESNTKICFERRTSARS